MKSIEIVHGGDKGYSVELPDTSYNVCPECLSCDHWELKELESEEKHKNKFIFKCCNQYDLNGVKYDCSGECLIKEGDK